MSWTNDLLLGWQRVGYSSLLADRLVRASVPRELYLNATTTASRFFVKNVGTYAKAESEKELSGS